MNVYKFSCPVWKVALGQPALIEQTTYSILVQVDQLIRSSLFLYIYDQLKLKCKILSLIGQTFLCSTTLLKNGKSPASSIFSSFQTNVTILTTNMYGKKLCPFSIRRRDSNPQPSDIECTPITTRPGLTPIQHHS